MNWTQRFAGLALAALAGLASAAAGDYVDRSGTVTLGGTSQTLVAADPNRGNITIYNLGTETEVLCVNVTSAASCTAAGSWQISPGGSLTLTTKEQINVVAATTGHKFTSKEKVTDGFALVNPGSSSGSGGGLTDTQLRASAVPVSLASVPSHAVTNAGTFAVQSTLQAGSAVIGKVSIDQTTPGTTNLVQLPDNAAITTSTCSAINCTLFTGVSTAGYDSFYFQNTTASGTYTINLQGSVDGTTYTDLKCQDTTATGSNGTALGSTSTAAALIQCRAAPLIQAKVLAYTSGTITASAVLSKKSYQPLVGIYNAASLSVNAGQAAHDAAVSGNPVRVGCRGRTSQYATTILNDDTVDVQCDLNGATVIKPFSVSGSDWNYAAAASGISNTTTAVQMVGAAGASIRNYVTGCTVQTNTLGGQTELVIQDSTPTVIWRTQLQTTALPLTHFYFATPKKGAANLALQVATLTAVTGNVYVNCDGYSAQ